MSFESLDFDRLVSELRVSGCTGRGQGTGRNHSYQPSLVIAGVSGQPSRGRGHRKSTGRAHFRRERYCGMITAGLARKEEQKKQKSPYLTGRKSCSCTHGAAFDQRVTPHSRAAARDWRLAGLIWPRNPTGIDRDRSDKMWWRREVLQIEGCFELSFSPPTLWRMTQRPAVSVTISDQPYRSRGKTAASLPTSF